MRIRWEDKIKNEEVLERSGQMPVAVEAERRRLQYLGHCLRRPSSIPFTSLGWAPEGKRRRGRPKETWRRATLKELKRAKINSWNEAAAIAADRDRWKDVERVLLPTLYTPRCQAT